MTEAWPGSIKNIFWREAERTKYVFLAEMYRGIKVPAISLDELITESGLQLEVATGLRLDLSEKSIQSPVAFPKQLLSETADMTFEEHTEYARTLSKAGAKYHIPGTVTTVGRAVDHVAILMEILKSHDPNVPFAGPRGGIRTLTHTTNGGLIGVTLSYNADRGIIQFSRALDTAKGSYLYLHPLSYPRGVYPRELL